ncbi:MAG: hypothetical protein JNL08_05625 [Planctomycetes bacterium]|nr:hypothetical protein [Planctomycetota bacterium]
MQGSELLWARARDHACDYLRRYTDPWTRSHRDDLVQEVALAAWAWSGGLRDVRGLWRATRTIARRVRYHALEDLARELCLQRQVAAVRDGGERCYRIAGRRVSASRALPWVELALGRLRQIDRHLLLEFHAGFCCAELSARSGWSETAVKTRIHRARCRLRKEIEAIVRTADDLDVSVRSERGEPR